MLDIVILFFCCRYNQLCRSLLILIIIIVLYKPEYYFLENGSNVHVKEFVLFIYRYIAYNLMLNNYQKQNLLYIASY